MICSNRKPLARLGLSFQDLNQLGLAGWTSPTKHDIEKLIFHGRLWLGHRVLISVSSLPFALAQEIDRLWSLSKIRVRPSWPLVLWSPKAP
jgi:hypothetical protein